MSISDAYRRLTSAANRQARKMRFAVWLDKSLPRYHPRNIHTHLRLHRIGLFLASALVVGTVVYLEVAPDDFNEKLRTLTAIATGVGALGLLINLMFTSETVENSNRTLEHQQRNQLDERFFKAADMLSSEDRIHARIAALFALERLANDSKEYYKQVIEVICVFVRQRSDKCRPTDEQLKNLDSDNLPKAPHDIDAAMRVLGRRKRQLGNGEHEHLDLRNINLCGLYLREADLAGAVLTGSLLIGTHLQAGNFARANLRGIDFRHAIFDHVYFGMANFEGSSGDHAKLLYYERREDPQHELPMMYPDSTPPKFYRPPKLAQISYVRAIDCLDMTQWSDTKFHGAKLVTAPFGLVERLNFKPDFLETTFTLHTYKLARGQQER